MFLKIVTIAFYLMIALFFLGFAFPYLEVILGFSALVLAIVHAIS